MNQDELTRRTLLKWGAAGVGALAIPGLATSCGGSSSKTAASDTTVGSATSAPPDTLLQAAKAEGTLNLQGVDAKPGSSWTKVLEGFEKQTGIKPTLMEGLDSPGAQLQAIRDRNGKKDQLDVVDVGLSTALDITQAKLTAPFQPEGWVDIPSAAKDADGNWLSSYYVLVGIVSNSKLLGGVAPPETFDDLKNLPGSVTVGFPGDPRSVKALTDQGENPVLAGSAAFGAVWTAALAQGGSLDDIGPGIDFFADLAAKGTFQPKKYLLTQTMGLGQPDMPQVSMLDTSAIGQARALATPGNELVLHIDSSAQLFPNYYAQLAVKGSPHPNAAKAWIQYLVSDDGAKPLLAGGQVPTRFPVLDQQGKLTKADLASFENVGLSADELSDKLSAVQIPTIDQFVKAQKQVDLRWASDVIGD